MIGLENFQTLIGESKALFRQGALAEAIAALRQAEQADPLSAEFVQIQQAMGQRDYQSVKTIAKQMLAKQPSHPRAVFTLSHLDAIQGRHEDRAARLRDAIKQLPASQFLRQQFVKALEDCGDFIDAIEAAKNLVSLNESVDNLLGLMQLLLRHGFNEEVLGFADKAYALCETDEMRSEVDLLRGQCLKILGRREEAIAALQDCLTHKPRGGAAWWALADMKDYVFSAKDMSEMSQLFSDMSLKAEHRIQAGFALAKAHELNGAIDPAMSFYKASNNLRGSRGFEPARFLSAIDSLTSVWSAEALSRQAETAQSGPTPIFIVGMPRSGSTLMEQILASHSEIEGTLEMMVLPSVKRKAHLRCVETYDQDYLSAIGRLPSDALAELGRAYLAGSGLYRKDSQAFFIDKLPNNFEHIGLIHKILPHAKIIDIRRHPLDCGYSLYKQYFRSGADYSYNLEHIGAYYNGYLKLMDHWHSCLPDHICAVQYEALIDNPEGEVRRVLDFVGLKFEDSCLRFYENKRAVRTPSSEQVRQPINRKGIGVWRPAEAHLQPLIESLGQATLDRFELSSPQ